MLMPPSFPSLLCLGGARWLAPTKARRADVPLLALPGSNSKDHTVEDGATAIQTLSQHRAELPGL